METQKQQYPGEFQDAPAGGNFSAGVRHWEGLLRNLKIVIIPDSAQKELRMVFCGRNSFLGNCAPEEIIAEL